MCGFIVLKMIFKAIKFLANLKKVRRKGSLNSVCGGFYVLKMDFMPNNQQEMKDLKEKNEELKA